jgi:hypothetical protein
VLCGPNSPCDNTCKRVLKALKFVDVSRRHAIK